MSVLEEIRKMKTEACDETVTNICLFLGDDKKADCRDNVQKLCSDDREKWKEAIRSFKEHNIYDAIINEYAKVTGCDSSKVRYVFDNIDKGVIDTTEKKEEGDGKNELPTSE